jgi:hypothetical protein
MEQNWILDKYIGVVPRGVLAGTPCARFEFGPALATNPEVRAIFDFIGTVSLASRTVVFSGVFPDRNANAFTAVVTSLADAGLGVVILTDGQSFQPFFTNKGVYVIVRLADPQWSSFPCAELFYDFAPGTTTEPIVPVKCASTYLVPGTGVGVKELMTFITSSKVHWKLAPARDLPWRLDLKEAEDVG